MSVAESFPKYLESTELKPLFDPGQPGGCNWIQAGNLNYLSCGGEGLDQAWLDEKSNEILQTNGWQNTPGAIDNQSAKVIIEADLKD